MYLQVLYLFHAEAQARVDTHVQKRNRLGKVQLEATLLHIQDKISHIPCRGRPAPGILPAYYVTSRVATLTVVRYSHGKANLVEFS